MSRYEWHAVEVSGTVADLAANLNTLDDQGYEIFDVNGMLLVNQHGWVIIARTARAAQAEKKPEAPPEPAKAPPEPAKAARGTVHLHKGRK